MFSAVLLGGMVRFMPALVTQFPINDGGMFHDMARDLQANHYFLPAATSYNGLDLPYAYPPFGMYLVSLLADVTRIPLLDLFLWLPPLLATLAIPAFYRLARALLADSVHAALATLFFALTPGRYDWHIMGGGITRATGMLFLLLAAFYVLRLFRSLEASDSVRLQWTPKSPDFGFAILFCSAAVLSHPEVGLQTAGLCFVLWLFLGRTWRGALHAFLVALGVFLFTAPWWGTVIAQHGLTPFLSAIQTGQHTSVDWLELLASVFVGGEFIPLLLILRVVGFIYAIWKKQFIFIALVFVPALIDPRSAASIAFLSLSMLAAVGFLEAIPALFRKAKQTYPPTPSASPPSLQGKGEGGIGHIGLQIIEKSLPFLSILVFILFVECGLRNYSLVHSTLTLENRAAMTWLRENISPRQNFLLLTGRTYSMSDPVQEWFPALTGQHSQTTLQGLEWTLGPQFTHRLDDLAALQSCLDLVCVESWSKRTGLEYDYLWVAKTPAYLAKDIRASVEYSLAYESETVAIFARVEK